jgi:hypothetical protein
VHIGDRYNETIVLANEKSRINVKETKLPQLIGEPPMRKAVTLNSTSPKDSTLTSIWLDGLAGIAAWLISFWVLLPGGK